MPRSRTTRTRRTRLLRALTPLLALAFACQTNEEGASTTQPSPEAGEAVAELGGRPISAGELDDYIKELLFRRRTSGRDPGKLYELRSQTLELLLNERIVEAEATRQKLTPEELVDREVAKLGPVTDEEIALFYAEHKAELGDAAAEDAAPRIRRFLEEERKNQVTAALREQAAVRVLLSPPRYEIAAEGASRGPENAKVTIVEFSDFQCPFCRRVIPILDEVLERYPDDVRVVYRHLPLDSIHPRARPAAEASECAREQEQFWPYHDKLFENSRALEDADLQRYATELGLDTESFERCLGESRIKQQVEDDVAAAQAVGITGTPAFVVNGIVLTGAKPPESFFKLIDAELERGTPSG